MSLIEKYKKLDELVRKDKEEEVNDTFKEILEGTFKIINKKIEDQKTLSVKNPEEKMAIRAMMEYMLELWDEGSIDEAKEVGYDMVYLVDDAKLKEMFTLFVIGMLAGLSLDKVFEKYVDGSEIYEDYFFTGFNDEIDELVEKYKNQFVKEFQE